MTSGQTIELREQWKQRVDTPACEHDYQEIEWTDSGGYLTGISRCIVCGRSVTKL